jgi:hypothetical protein
MGLSQSPRPTPPLKHGKALPALHGMLPTPERIWTQLAALVILVGGGGHGKAESRKVTEAAKWRGLPTRAAPGLESTGSCLILLPVLGFRAIGLHHLFPVDL